MNIRNLFKRKQQLTGFIYNAWEHTDWGNNIQWSNFDERRIVGWLFRIPEVGDEIRFKMKSGKTARMYVKSVERAHGVDDMFFADLEDIGYVGEPMLNKCVKEAE